MPFRPQDYADLRTAEDDREEFYPDGTPKHECWNSAAALQTRRPAQGKQPPDADRDDDRADDPGE